MPRFLCTEVIVGLIFTVLSKELSGSRPVVKRISGRKLL